MARIKFAGREMQVPGPPLVRISLGIFLIVCGLLGFLPILGFWMVPMGFLVLSIDLPFVRRWRRRFQVWYETRKRRKRDAASCEHPREDS
ncbi:MAG: hypothetical protein ACR2GY_08435 [Phycisphaerales bacterium]